MSEELKQQRTREQWSKCNPKMMAQQSPAAIMYAIQDARLDIDALHRQADQLRAELSHLKAGQGEAAEYQQLSRYGHWERVDKSVFYLGLVGACPERFRALYTSPPTPDATQVMAPGISRESITLAYRLVTTQLETLANGSAIGRYRTAQSELRAILAQSQEEK